MTTEQILRTFTEYLRERGHRVVPGATLVRPPGDPVLFTSSGMHPLTPYLEGRPHPLGRRLAGVQRCLRTTDLDEVGDLTHLTVFEMLGSWSLGDYGIGHSLRQGYDMLTDAFGVDPRRLHATVFGGDRQLGPDDESLHTWQELGVPVERNAEDNWWSNGPTGLCGPDSEIFVWTGDTPPEGVPSGDRRWVEVWNHVNMGHRRREDRSLQPLPQPNIDTGMGLERLAMVLQGRRSVFDIDVFEPWTRTLPALWGLDPGGSALRTAADHLRSGIAMIGDGVRPAGTGHGYVLRRLLRRVLTVLRREGRDEPPVSPGDDGRALADLPDGLVEHTRDRFRQAGSAGSVRQVLLDEEQRFTAALDRGRRVLARERFAGRLGEQDYRYLHDTHGLPRELVDLLREPAPARGDGKGR
jgi:alanyl-tRNA synthetase